MDVPLFLPDSSALRLENVSVVSGVAEIFVSSARPVARCPACGHPAARVHSRYQRTLQDLSWQGKPAKIRWRTRRFFCDTPGCPQEIFTERLTARSFARRVGRLIPRRSAASLGLLLVFLSAVVTRMWSKIAVALRCMPASPFRNCTVDPENWTGV